jgi:hypothetical protein
MNCEEDIQTMLALNEIQLKQMRLYQEIAAEEKQREIGEQTTVFSLVFGA